MSWLEERCRQSGHNLMPLYGIDGRADVPETELTHLSGYCGSRPVRLGNGAHTQL